MLIVDIMLNSIIGTYGELAQDATNFSHVHDSLVHIEQWLLAPLCTVLYLSRER